MVTFDIITPSGQIIPLKGIETQQQLKTLNAAFQFDEIDGQVVWDLEIPFEDNQKALGHEYQISIKSNIKVYSAQLKEHNVVLFKGIITVYNTAQLESGSTISAEFIVDDFVYKALNLTIQDVCERIINLRPGAVTTTEEAAQHYSQNGWPNSPIYFPVCKNEGFYGDNNPDFLGIINPYSASEDNYLPADKLYTEVIPVTGGAYTLEYYQTIYTYVPSVYAMEVFKGIAKYFNYELRGSLFRHLPFHRVIVAGGYSLDKSKPQQLAIIEENAGLGFFFGATLNESTSEFYLPFNTIGAGNEYEDIDLTDDQPYLITSQEPLQVTISTTIRYESINAGQFAEATLDLYVRTNGITGNGVQFSQELQLLSADNDLYNNTYATFQATFTPAAGDVGERLGLYLKTSQWSSNTELIRLTQTRMVIGYTSDFTQNTGLEQFRLGDTLPPVGVSDFLRRIKNTFCTTLEVDSLNRTITMDLLKEQERISPVDIPLEHTQHDFRKVPVGSNKYKLTHEDTLTKQPNNFIGQWTSRAQLPSTRLFNTALVLNEMAYYQYNFNPELVDEEEGTLGGNEWQFIKYAYDGYTEGEETAEEVEIATGITIPPIVFTKFTEDSTIEYMVPELDFDGAGSSFGLPALPDHELHLLMAVGKQPATSGEHYAASTTGLNINGEPCLEAYLNRSMHWSGTYGLVLHYWKRFIRLLAESEEVEIQVKLPLAQRRAKQLNRPLRVLGQKVYTIEQTSELGAEAFDIIRVKKP